MAHAEQYEIEKLTDSQVNWNNQTITYVFVTVSESDPEINSQNNHHYGELMTSSAAILGFIGFASIINVGNFTKEIKEKLVLMWVLYGSIALMISLHLTLIIFAYFEAINDNYFLFVMITTIVVIVVMIVVTGYLSYSKSTYPLRRHQTKNILDMAMRQFLLKDTTQSDDSATVGNPLEGFDKK